jgi:hypothetical protein
VSNNLIRGVGNRVASGGKLHVCRTLLIRNYRHRPDGTYGQGELTMIADNGDILYGTYTNGISLSDPPVVGFTDDFTFHDGGTGRFTFASGGGIDLGSVDFNDFSFTMQMTGVIAYKKK